MNNFFGLVKGMAGGTQDIPNFMPNQFLDPAPCRTEILARIKLLGIFPQHFAESRSHRQSKVCVDVDFCATNPPRNFYIRLRHTCRIVAQFAAVSVDLLDEILRDARGPVEDEWVVAQSGVHQGLLDCLQSIQIKVLMALELVRAM